MKLTDKEIVTGILAGNKQSICQFFFEECTPIFRYIISKIFDYQAEKDELINELYIYLQENDWKKLRQFDYRSKLTTWISVVATRFFQKKRAALIENESFTPPMVEKVMENDSIVHKLDIESLLNGLTNERYRSVIRKLVLEDYEPQTLANEMGITVDNLYNIKRRALSQLAHLYRKEDGYVG